MPRLCCARPKCSCHVFRSKSAESFQDFVNTAFEARAAEDGGANGGINRQSSFLDNGGGKKRSGSIKYMAKGADSGLDDFGGFSTLAFEASMGVGASKGKLLKGVECTYYGKAPVPTSKGDKTLDDARNQVLQHSEQLPGHFSLYSKCIELANPQDGEYPHHANVITDCTFAKFYSDLDVFAYILRDNRTDTLEAYFIGVAGADPADVSLKRIIDGAIKKMNDGSEGAGKKKKAKKGKQSAKGKKGKVAQSVPPAFEASFLGFVTVRKGVGQNMADTCTRLVSQSGEALGVFIQIGAEAVRCFDALTHEVKASFTVSQIKFIATSGASGDNLCISYEDVMLDSTQCYVFKCTNKARAGQLEVALKGTGAGVQAGGGGGGEGAKKAGPKHAEDSPFVGEGERMAAPGNLFKRQVHRNDLTPVKVIGAGQFGQVWSAKQNTKTGEINCAVKMLKDVKSEADRDEFIHEVQMRPSLVLSVGAFGLL